MKSYEVLYIVRPDMEAEEVQAVADKYRDFIVQNGGEEQSTQIIGKRKLAYEIKDFADGVYVLTLFHAPTSLSAHLGRQMELDEAVVRHMVILHTGPALTYMAAEKARAEAADREEAASQEPAAEPPPAEAPAEEAPVEVAASEPEGESPAAEEPEPEISQPLAEEPPSE